MSDKVPPSLFDLIKHYTSNNSHLQDPIWKYNGGNWFDWAVDRAKYNFDNFDDNTANFLNNIIPTEDEFTVPGDGGLFGMVDSYIGNTLTGSRDYERQKELLESQMAFNALEAQKTRDYETQMSNTAYQRAAADMKAVGLNPALMFGSGQAASTPIVHSAHQGSNAGVNSLNSVPLNLVGGIVNAVFRIMDHQTLSARELADLQLREKQLERYDSSYNYKVAELLKQKDEAYKRLQGYVERSRPSFGQMRVDPKIKDILDHFDHYVKH